MTRALIVANPVARGVSDRLLDEVQQAAGALAQSVTLCRTTRPGETVTIVADALADAAGHGTPIGGVIAVGGDGSAREAAEGIARGLCCWPRGEVRSSGPTLFVVPAGAGNSAYEALWSKRSWQESLPLALGGGAAQVRRLDLIRIVEDDAATLLGVNVGLGGRIAKLLGGVAHVDDAARMQAIAGAVAGVGAPPCTVTVDGAPMYEGPLAQLTVGGVRRFMGAGLELLPHSKLDDGLLDACIVTRIDPATFGELVADMRTGAHLERPDVVYAQGRRLTIERTDGELLEYEHDGDPRPDRASLTLEIVPAAVPVAAG